MSEHPVPSKNTSDRAIPLGSSFFDVLWPLILDENVCRIESKAEENFVPKEPFNRLEWHTYLAQVGYPFYMPPHELRCCEGARRQEFEEEEAEKALNKEVEERRGPAEGDFLCRGSQAIRPIDKEVVHLRMEQERRQKLAYDFANRRYPWTMQTPSHELGFTLTEELQKCFKGPMELDILNAIHDFDCKLMIIDLGPEVDIRDCQRWIKFRPYIQLLALVRTPRMDRSLQLLNVFHTLLVEESADNSWDDELQCSVRTGYRYAQKIQLLKTCGEPLVFVFSRFRGICTCDNFKIIRRA
ncbi:uncharacterized protein LOC119560407 [Drosophila subpulchrella]|uniref:uncharacterized protein LOC119560407 n=1 Tax=Drosophila subpulchrella TaxID=1486046 RepID=UPI0018A18C4D|nr:uncharacterized protein LOC119560407 [Drosophila subpulchrella]